MVGSYICPISALHFDVTWLAGLSKTSFKMNAPCFSGKNQLSMKIIINYYFRGIQSIVTYDQGPIQRDWDYSLSVTKKCLSRYSYAN